MNGLTELNYANTNSQVHGEDKTTEFALGDLPALAERTKRKIIVVHNSVFDVTEYLHHPGGPRFHNRLYATDQDASNVDRTEMFEETIHTDLTRETLLRHYRIGYLRGQRSNPLPKMGEYKLASELAFKPVDLRSQAEGGGGAAELGVLAVTLVGAAVGYWWWCKRKTV